MKPLRVAVADDSSFVRKALVRLLSGDPRITVVGVAASGEELIEQLEVWKPDAITLDLSMPGMGGMLTLDRIREIRPTPVIVLSSRSARGAPLTIEALHRGAVDFIDKQCYSMVDFQGLREVLVEKLLLAGGASAGPASREGATAEPVAAVGETVVSPAGALAAGRLEAVLLGASTGGPPAIQQILEGLGAELPVPMIVVQHMPRGFTRAFADRLNAHLPLPVREAKHGELLAPATVYIAPGGVHLRLERHGTLLAAALGSSPADAAHKPSVDVLFLSAAAVLGSRALAVLLTGMGRDGALGMAGLAAAGAYTLAQDETSSAVYGMPRAALEIGGVRETLSLERIASRLRELLRFEAGSEGEVGGPGTGGRPAASRSA